MLLITCSIQCQPASAVSSWPRYSTTGATVASEKTRMFNTRCDGLFLESAAIGAKDVQPKDLDLIETSSLTK